MLHGMPGTQRSPRPDDTWSQVKEKQSDSSLAGLCRHSSQSCQNSHKVLPRVPDRIKGMICSYLRGIKLRFKTTNCITQWQHHEKTIVTGCAVSPSLSSCYEPHEKCNQRLGEELKHLITVIKDFVDDLIITTSSHVQAKLVLTKLDEVATQTTMTKGQQQHPQYWRESIGVVEDYW